MDRIRIRGGRPLQGRIPISGAKNATLPLMIASLLTDETLVLENVSPRTEIQLLRYQHPDPLPDAHIRDLNRIGMNHICFAVDDVQEEVAKLKARGFKLRNEIMDFHSRKLVFIEGPEGVTVELAEWH